MWYPTTMSFPTKNDHFGVFWGYPYFGRHPHSKQKKDIWESLSNIIKPFMRALISYEGSVYAASSLVLVLSTMPVQVGDFFPGVGVGSTEYTQDIQ